MSSTEILALLLKTTLVSSAAVTLALILRRPLRHWLGASAAYLLWLLLPVTLLAALLPAPRVAAVPMRVSEVAVQVGQAVVAGPAVIAHWPLWLCCAWLAGGLLMAVHLYRQQRSFQRGLGRLSQRDDGLWQAQAVAGLPAAVGLLRPRIVLPAGFEQRYLPIEQQLVLLHERVHLQRGDIVINALLALLQCLYWFNPLLLFALRCCREDQELSCDERVIARVSGARRSYGEAMLKTGLAASPLPVGCHWQNHHPLKERIAMLKRPVPGRKQWCAMLVLSLGLSSAFGYTAWAAQPGKAVSTSSSTSTSSSSSTSTTTGKGTVYATFVEATLEGTKQRFELQQSAGTPFSFSASSDKGVQWAAEFTLQPAADGMLTLKGTLKANGDMISSPTLLIKPDVAAGIEVSTADGRSTWALELRSIALAAGDPAIVSAAPGKAEQVGLPNAGRMPPPSYPRAAIDSGTSGKVVLRIAVDAEGRATDVVVTEAHPKGVFEEVSIAAARQWRFTPAMKDGKPVAGLIRVPISFDMDEEEMHYTETQSRG